MTENIEQKPEEQQESNYEELIPESAFKDSIFLVYKGGIHVEVRGGLKDAKRFRWPWWHRAVGVEGGRPGWVKGWGLAFVLMKTAREKRETAIEAAKKAGQEAKAKAEAEAKAKADREAWEHQQQLNRIKASGFRRIPGGRH